MLYFSTKTRTYVSADRPGNEVDDEEGFRRRKPTGARKAKRKRDER